MGQGPSGRSPLSSHDHSPVDSENGSTRSSASSGIGLELHHATAPAPPRASAFTPPPEKKYFGHKKDPNAPAADAGPKPAAPPAEAKKNNRFNMFKKGSTVAAH
ncbi:hypothetical protein H2203_006274 [Taxawa tesnikishii (nom. ined.)]|nr:hypothetical protein H2203_006274 [Dothideales sp. JES 119]